MWGLEHDFARGDDIRALRDDKEDKYITQTMVDRYRNENFLSKQQPYGIMHLAS